ncbi:hypothetical protein ASE75_05780 [Sphingomonas sp. Leaf17]|nr:hypothetical protein ASE75_05780 [Sphingomonas sp. Leaf17]
MPARADTGDLSAYLRGRAAEAAGRPAVALDAYATALAASPANPVIAAPAYRAALNHGDIALARRAAGVLQAAGVAPADVALLAIADAAHAGDPRMARLAVQRLQAGPLMALTPAIEGWIALTEGRASPAPAGPVSDDAVARRFTAEARVQLLIASGQVDAGLAGLDALGGARAPLDLRIAVARLLAGQGRGEQAAALLPGDAPMLAALRKAPGVRPSMAFGISRIFTRVAADLATGETGTMAIALGRIALVADPANDRARLILADALSRSGATDDALSVLAAIDRSGPYAGAVAAARVAVLALAGRSDPVLAETALVEARALADRADAGPDDWQRYADLLTAAARPAEAATWYARVTKAPDTADDWAAWLQYGGALDEAGQWLRAEPALVRAVALAPAEPLALNYLGYARIVRGEDMAASARMLERARALKPDDPSIIDSLGWAYHLTGDSARALPLLERAAAAAPTNAEIAEHLGDAYWTLGRRYDARYAWRAAAVVADATTDARLAGKIAGGLATAKERSR